MEKEKRSYDMCDYDPSWVDEYLEITNPLLNIFRDVVISHHHVGSTSIPGMRAKPIVDVLIVVKDLSQIEPFVEEVCSLGYELIRNYIADNTCVFVRNIGNKRVRNIHVLPEGHHQIKRFLYIRDFLRENEEKQKEYINLKIELKKEFPDDYISYRNGKNKFLDSVFAEAEEWVDKKP